MASDALGQAAVALARWSVEDHLGLGPDPRPPLPPPFRRKGAAFVTLTTHPEGRLRGCIGYPRPLLPLAASLERAAVAACHDPRFPPLTPSETEAVVVEVSLLKPPVLLRVASPREYLRAVVPGRDGLAVEYGGSVGLLLPQVALDGGLAPEDLLVEACLKAGLLPDAWFEPGVRVSTFQADVFAEAHPRGPVVRRLPAPVHDGH